MKSPLLISFQSMVIFSSVRAVAQMTTSVTQSSYTYESDEKPVLYYSAVVSPVCFHL